MWLRLFVIQKYVYKKNYNRKLFLDWLDSRTSAGSATKPNKLGVCEGSGRIGFETAAKNNGDMIIK